MHHWGVVKASVDFAVFWSGILPFFPPTCLSPTASAFRFCEETQKGYIYRGVAFLFLFYFGWPVGLQVVGTGFCFGCDYHCLWILSLPCGNIIWSIGFGTFPRHMGSYWLGVCHLLFCFLLVLASLGARDWSPCFPAYLFAPSYPLLDSLRIKGWS